MSIKFIYVNLGNVLAMCLITWFYAKRKMWGRYILYNNLVGHRGWALLQDVPSPRLPGPIPCPFPWVYCNCLIFSKIRNCNCIIKVHVRVKMKLQFLLTSCFWVINNDWYSLSLSQRLPLRQFTSYEWYDLLL